MQIDTLVEFDRRPISVPRSILIVRPSALGDVCRTVPVLASLRRTYPDARIDWVVQDNFAPAVASHPDLDQVVAFPRGQMANWWRSPAALRKTLGWFAQVRRAGYDLVIDFQGLGRSGLVTRITGAKRRVGARDAREFGWLGYNVRHRLRTADSGPIHTVDYMLALLEAEGIEIVRDMRLYVSESDAEWWVNKRESLGITPGRYAVLAPTSRWFSKRWPIERWVELVRPLLMRGFEHAVLIGGPNEQEQVKPILPADMPADSPLVNLVDQTSIGQTMAVIAQSGLVIANDSAPLHMAVGFDRPCVGLFGPTDPKVVGPYRRESAALRAFVPKPGEIIDYKDAKLADRLMRVISTAAVIERIDRVLMEHAPNEQLSPQPQQCPGGGS